MPKEISNVFVTCVYGKKYSGFLLPHMHSIYEHHPEAKHLLLWQEMPEHEIELIRQLFPRSDIRETSEDFKSSNPAVRIPSKLKLWLKACEYYPESRLCFLDCDTLVVRSLDKYFTQKVDALFTWKEGKFPLNTGVFFINSPLSGTKILRKWLAETVSVIDFNLEKALKQSGAADQHALRQIVGFASYENYSNNIYINGEAFRFAGIPCANLNQTECGPIKEDTHIIHYKSGWHPILFNQGPFTKARSKSACLEMYSYFNEQSDLALENRLKGKVLVEAEKRKDRFEKLTQKIRYEAKGILHSEMLSVVSTCEALKVDVIIESGRCRGQSTAALAEYFKDTSMIIDSVEYLKDQNASFAEERLKDYKINLLYGDSFKVIPERLKLYRNKRVALLVDGPKGRDAILLIQSLIKKFNNICLCYIHDTTKGTVSRALTEKTFRRVLFTDDEDYNLKFSYLDKPCEPSGDNPITIHTWRPYKKGDNNIKSYGPTLAIIFPYSFEWGDEFKRLQEHLFYRFKNILRFFGIHHIVRAIRSLNSLRSSNA